MRKKFLKVSASVLLLSSMGLFFPSCSDDYDADISRLEQEIAANAAAIQQIQDLVKSGSVISNVESSANGVTVTLSNGKTFEITNGTNGIDGTPGTVWTIGDDDYWYQDGVKTEYLARGPQGEQGIQGPQGEKGEKGDTGAQGEKGEKGDTGDQGPQGEKGEKGDTGATGAPGAQGEKGEKGDTGATGAPGAQGEKGEKGDTGATGAPGAQGEKGEKGDTGAQGPQGEKGDSIYYVPNVDGFFHKFVNGQDVEQTSIKWQGTGVTAAMTDDDVVIVNVDGDPNKKFIISRSNVLRSLVFEPDLYWNGIEAIEAVTYTYNIWDIKLYPDPVNTDNKGDKPTAPTGKDPKKNTVTPDLVATYIMNPSNVIGEQLFDYKFTSKNAKVVTRSNDAVTPDIYDHDVTTNPGKITVTARYTGDITANSSNITTVALQVSQKVAGETATITSDYAAIYPVKQNIEGLAAPTAKKQTPLNSRNQYWWDTAQDAIDNATEIEVAFDKTIDLSEYVETRVKDADGEQVLKNVEKRGFKYEYELLGYTKTTADKTSESVYAAMKGSILHPQAPTESGTQDSYDDTKNSRSTIGRLPLVRVTLHDIVNLNDPKKAVAVGYLKVKIVDSNESKDKPEPIEMKPFTNDYVIDCNKPGTPMTYKWSDVEFQILQKLNMSKQEFETTYILDKNGSEATQYEWSDKTNKYEERNPYMGKVELAPFTGDDAATSILSWTIDNNTAYEYFTSEQKPTKAHVTIRFERGTGSGIYLYITLKWEPKNIFITPEGSLAGKNDTHWFEKWSPEKGLDEIHFNVLTPGTGMCDFEDKLSSVWNSGNGSIPSVSFTSNGSKYSTFNIAKYSLVINDDVKNQTGASGTKYVLSVQGDDLMAALASAPTGTKRTIATLNNPLQPGIATLDITEDKWAKDLLNHVASNKLGKGETFTAAIKVSISDGCGREVKLSDSTFNVRFQRPITVTQDRRGVLKDGRDYGDTLYMKDVLSFIDWRNNDEGKFTTANSHFTYYGVTNIEVGEWRNGNLNYASGSIQDYAKVVGRNQTVAQYNKDIDLTYKIESPSPSMDDMGYIVYKNNGTSLSDNYDIEVPFVIEYKWGCLPVKVTITIQKTVGI